MLEESTFRSCTFFPAYVYNELNTHSYLEIVSQASKLVHLPKAFIGYTVSTELYQLRSLIGRNNLLIQEYVFKQES